MNLTSATAIHREEDDELLGYIRQNGDYWEALTIFGYVFGETESEKNARNLVLEKGLGILTGTWEYRDDETGEWLGCVLVEVSQNSARVARMDGPYPDTSRTYLIEDALETKLRQP